MQPGAKTMASDPHGIESHLDERRSFPPPKQFAERAHVKSMSEYEQMARRAADDPTGFWTEQARAVDWLKPFERVLDDSKAPFYKWFTGGQLNLSANCLDRHLATRGNKRAL